MWWVVTMNEILQRVIAIQKSQTTIVQSQAAIVHNQAAAELRLIELAKALIDNNQRLRRIEMLLRQPGLMTLSITGDDPMLKFEIQLPPASATDVVKGELSVKIGEADAFTLETGVAVNVADEKFSGNEKDAVHAELVYIDDAGNKSAPSILDVTLTDTIAPGQPGEMSLKVTEES